MDFLKSELRKFILPTIMLITFVFVLNDFYVFGSLQDSYMCDVKEYAMAVELMMDNKFCHEIESGTIAYGDVTIEEQTKHRFELAIERAIEMSGYWNDKELTELMLLIDPFLPVPCEYMNTPFCEHYMTEKSYDCAISTNNQYRPASVLAIIISATLLLIEGYLVSCVVFGFLNLIKKPEKKRPIRKKHSSKKTKRRKFKSSGR
ncbi:MAG: hypothetical protein ABH842_03630 [Candidatus Micrarchaeota archaeon]